MATAYKTTGGLVRATEKVIAELETYGIAGYEDEKRLGAVTSNLLRQLNALWSSPADVAEMRKLSNRLRDAWTKALLGDAAESY